MNTQYTNRLIAAGLALTATFAATSGVANATALTDVERVTVSVRVGDLDINSAPAARQAYARLRNAGEAVCGEDAAAHRDLILMSEIRGCEQHALQPVVVRLNSQPLTALYRKDFHVNPATIVAEPTQG